MCKMQSTMFYEWGVVSTGVGGYFIREKTSAAVLRAIQEKFGWEFGADDWEKLYASRLKGIELAKAAWKGQSELLGNLDELDQAIRLKRLKAAGEEVSEEEKFSVLDSREAAIVAIHDDEIDIATRRADLADSKKHLENMKTMKEKEEKEEAVECSICLDIIGDEDVAILRCGHQFHNRLVPPRRAKRVPCIQCVHGARRCASVARAKRMLLTHQCEHGARRCAPVVPRGSLSASRWPLKALPKQAAAADGLFCDYRSAAPPSSCPIPNPLASCYQGWKNKKTCPNCKEVMLSEDISVVAGVKGKSLSSKVTAIVKDVKLIKERGERVVVMTQYADFLVILKDSFDLNEIGCVVVKGGGGFGAGIAKWEKEGGCVLCANIAQAGEGLTLIQANNLIICDSVVDGALDDQAKNRINRIGQTKETVVRRYVVEDSVEVAIEEARMERLRAGGKGGEGEMTKTLKGEGAEKLGFCMRELKKLFGVEDIEEGEVVVEVGSGAGRGGMRYEDDVEEEEEAAVVGKVEEEEADVVVVGENEMFLASLDSETREDALLGADEEFVSSLPTSVWEEARRLKRETEADGEGASEREEKRVKWSDGSSGGGQLGPAARVEAVARFFSVSIAPIQQLLPLLEEFMRINVPDGQTVLKRIEAIEAIEMHMIPRV